MIKKGIFGGTFDPIHIGHMYIAHEALWTLGLNKVIFMPSGTPPHKVNKNITDAEMRYHMVKKAVEQKECFEVSDYEINKRGYSYTYETVEYFKNLEGENTQWYFITGCDCLFDIPYWRNPERILSACTLTVFNRPGYDMDEILEQKRYVEDKYKTNIIFLNLLNIEVSSTYIRNSVSQGKDISFFLPERVYEIILDEKLYK